MGGPWLEVQTLALDGAGVEASWCWGLGWNWGGEERSRQLGRASFPCQRIQLSYNFM